MLTLHDPLLIVTDLDGTLLDHHTYQWQPAAGWLETLRLQDVPVVLCSSRTAGEIRQIQHDLGLSGRPFIAENGGVIVLDGQWHNDPDYPHYIPDLSATAIEVILAELRLDYGFKFLTFGDVTAEIISEWTGLPVAQAILAQQREASQVLIWRDGAEDLVRFSAALAERGMSIIEGGRFFHVQGERASKGQGLHWLTTRFQQREGHARVTIGLGDSPNDITLLEAADYAVVVKGYNRHGIALSGRPLHRVYRTTHYGPEGWREGLNYLFNRP